MRVGFGGRGKNQPVGDRKKPQAVASGNPPLSGLVVVNGSVSGRTTPRNHPEITPKGFPEIPLGPRAFRPRVAKRGERGERGEWRERGEGERGEGGERGVGGVEGGGGGGGGSRGGSGGCEEGAGGAAINNN